MELNIRIEHDKREYFRVCMPVFQALSDEHRLEILFMLMEGGTLNVKQISAQMSISRPAISHHLKILRQADIVKFTKEGTKKYYSLNRGYGNPLQKMREMALSLAIEN
ncbi:metalloregulator ArsR/SmtB family transcription factor [Christensenellaceae bacterium OttesenSCG-928-M15]|nr:metalloregulator ArsR/SmtB family transcription factor [Christensenellaceae bacterium OttesenSCG-928-M15]